MPLGRKPGSPFSLEPQWAARIEAIEVAHTQSHTKPHPPTHAHPHREEEEMWSTLKEGLTEFVQTVAADTNDVVAAVLQTGEGTAQCEAANSSTAPTTLATLAKPTPPAGVPVPVAGPTQDEEDEEEDLSWGDDEDEETEAETQAKEPDAAPAPAPPAVAVIAPEEQQEAQAAAKIARLQQEVREWKAKAEASQAEAAHWMERCLTLEEELQAAQIKEDQAVVAAVLAATESMAQLDVSPQGVVEKRAGIKPIAQTEAEEEEGEELEAWS